MDEEFNPWNGRDIVKIGKLDFSTIAMKKPLLISSEGKFISVAQAAETPSLSRGSLFSLSEDLQAKLTLERYSLEPDFNLGIVGTGLYTRQDVMEHIRNRTEFGRLAIRAEMGYCNELASAIQSRSLPAWPKPTFKPVKEFEWWKPVQKCIHLLLKNRALFCENTTDSVAAPIANWRINNIHPVFTQQGFTVLCNSGVDNTRANFESKVKSVLVTYVGGVGHGNYDRYTGHWSEVILQIGNYDTSEVRKKAFHFLSCRTGRDLGPDTVQHEARVYCGYDENFTFVWDNTTTPVNEFVLFVQADGTFDQFMASGVKASDAYNATIGAFNAAIAQVPNTTAATWLTYDRDHLRLHGDGNTTIKPHRWVKICFPIHHWILEDHLVRAGVLEN